MTQGRNSFLVVLTVLFALLMTLSGCVEPHPLIRQEIREKLRTAEHFKTEGLITKPAEKLEGMPLEPSDEIVERTRSIVKPDTDLTSIKMHLIDIRKNALENNLDLKVDQYNPSISEQGYLVEQGKFEAVFGASAGFERTNDVFGESTETVSLEPSIRVPTRTGGTVTINLPYSQEDGDTLNAFTGQTIGKSYRTNANLSLSQPLLRNAGLKVNHATIEMAGLQMRQADSRMKLSAIRLLANAEKAYWLYYAAHEDLKIQIRKYELAKEQVKLARRMVEEGVLTKVEITRAKTGEALQFESIIIGETSRRRTERDLKRIINLPDLPIDSDTIIQPASPPLLEGLYFDRKKVEQLSYQNRMELFENELQQAIDNFSVDLNKNALLPDLRFNFIYAFSGDKPELSDSIDQFFTDELNRLNLGLAIEMPLEGNRAAQSRLRESILRKKQTLAGRRSLHLAIQQEVLDAIDALDQHWQRILSNRYAVALAAETYEAEKLQFQDGLVTSTEVLQALSSLSEAESVQVQAISDYQTSLVDLAFATGTVLGQSGVIWTPARAE